MPDYEKRHERKVTVLTHYGNGRLACVRCNETREACLSIDHINGRGELERRLLGRSAGHPFYHWLIQNGFPSGYQTLCMNCQFVKREENREYASEARKQTSKVIGAIRRFAQLSLGI